MEQPLTDNNMNESTRKSIDLHKILVDTIDRLDFSLVPTVNATAVDGEGLFSMLIEMATVQCPLINSLLPRLFIRLSLTVCWAPH